MSPEIWSKSPRSLFEKSSMNLHLHQSILKMTRLKILRKWNMRTNFVLLVNSFRFLRGISMSFLERLHRVGLLDLFTGRRLTHKFFVLVLYVCAWIRQWRIVNFPASSGDDVSVDLFPFLQYCLWFHYIYLFLMSNNLRLKWNPLSFVHLAFISERHYAQLYWSNNLDSNTHEHVHTFTNVAAEINWTKMNMVVVIGLNTRRTTSNF